MLQKTRFAVFLFSVAGLAPLYAGKPGGCTDIPTQWTLNDRYLDGTLSAIQADAAGSYINGQSGVSALIKICDANGTNNAVLMTGSSRKLSFNFGHMLASNANTPSWATGILTGSGGVLNVHRLTFVPIGYDRSQEYDFTTWFGSDLPVKGFWGFRMWKPSTDAISDDPNTNQYLATANDPYIDTAVNAHHCPARNPAASAGPCAGMIHETWLISPDADGTTYADGSPAPPSAVWVGGLVNTQKTFSPLNAGQFSMSFSLTISVLQ